jgi:hypothetical protein
LSIDVTLARVDASRASMDNGVLSVDVRAACADIRSWSTDTGHEAVGGTRGSMDNIPSSADPRWSSAANEPLSMDR